MSRTIDIGQARALADVLEAPADDVGAVGAHDPLIGRVDVFDVGVFVGYQHAVVQGVEDYLEQGIGVEVVDVVRHGGRSLSPSSDGIFAAEGLFSCICF
jgi:hypothetical protein